MNLLNCLKLLLLRSNRRFIDQVYWTAPEQGSGCIQLKAMVVERNDYWFMDDGG